MKKITLFSIVLLLSYLKPYCQDSLFVGKSLTSIGTYKANGKYQIMGCDQFAVYEFYSGGKGLFYTTDNKGKIGASASITWILEKNKIVILSENNPKDVSVYKFLTPWLLQTLENNGDVNLFLVK